jgi:hypothetical protein
LRCLRLAEHEPRDFESVAAAVFTVELGVEIVTGVLLVVLPANLRDLVARLAGERTANLVVTGPAAAEDPDKLAAAGTEPWALRAFRELDDALLHLRFDLPDIGMVTVRTTGTAGGVKE